MSLEILQSRRQYVDARRELVKARVSSIDTPLQSLFRRLRLLRSISVGEVNKSWDVLQTLNFLSLNVGKSEPVLDIGCYASEIILALHKAGFANLTGADLDPGVGRMPFQHAIRYVATDFMHTPFPDASFRAITSISVIEHGFNGPALLCEVSRLLTADGFFTASFDYWPDKIDTSGIRFFGLDWKIFSKEDVETFIDQAASYGLMPAGQVRYDGAEAPIECAGKRYTFAWLALRKTVR